MGATLLALRALFTACLFDVTVATLIVTVGVVAYRRARRPTMK